MTTGILLPRPVDGIYPISCQFGEKGDVWAKGYHTGVDFAVPKGTDIWASLYGKVQLAGLEEHFGKRIWILADMSFGQVRILYAHCSELLVGPGDNIRVGQMIARSGNTGKRKDGKPMAYHLHLQAEMWPSRELLKPDFYEIPTA